jgi:hypothetical protein
MIMLEVWLVRAAVAASALSCIAIVATGCGDSTSCFVAGTLVDTPDGPVAIEQVGVGDRVFAYDESRRERVVSRVTRTFVHHDARVRSVSLSNGRSVGVTDEHPFFDAARQEYIVASDLTEGVELLALDPANRDGEPLVVADLGAYRDAAVVYNIEVDTHHNYFVEGILVHNKSLAVDGGRPDAETMMSDSTRTGTRLVTALCVREAECCPGNENDCTLIASILDQRLTTDGVVLDAAAYDACLEGLETASCDTVAAYGGRIHLGTFCDALAVGTLPLGARCGGLFGDDQCESGNCVDDMCAARSGEGAMCGPGSSRCEDGFACSLGACVVPTAPGESCELTNACSDGHGCFRMGDETEARCHPLRTVAVGEECAMDGLCELGPDACRCPLGGTGCTLGLCGDTSRCLP